MVKASRVLQNSSSNSEIRMAKFEMDLSEVQRLPCVLSKLLAERTHNVTALGGSKRGIFEENPYRY